MIMKGFYISTMNLAKIGKCRIYRNIFVEYFSLEFSVAIVCSAVGDEFL